MSRHCPPGRLLDFGCGTGHIGGHLATLGHKVDGCDLSSGMLEEGRRIFGSLVEFQLLERTWSTLPYADGQFDAAIASSVLEYVENPTQALAELARVVRPGGFVFATVPNMRHPRRWVEEALERALRFRPFSAVAELNGRASLHAEYLRTSRNRFSADEWVRRFYAAGFSLRDRRPASALLDLYALHSTHPLHRA